MLDRSFWSELGISDRMLNKMPSTWFRTFKQKIKEFEGDEDLIINFFGLKEIYLDDNDLLKEIYKKESAKEFYGLFHYIREKAFYLKDFFKQIGLNEKYLESPFKGLIYLYTLNKEIILNSSYYVNCQKTPLLESWIITPEIKPDALREKIKKNFLNFTKSFKLGENRISRIFEIQDKLIFCFEKGKKEGVIFGYGEKANLRKRGVYFACFDLRNNSLTIRSGNPKVGDMFFEILESEGYQVFIEQKENDTKEIKELSDKIINGDSKKAKITEIEFNSLGKGVKCQCKLSENNDKVLIKDCVKKLIEAGFVDPEDIYNLKNFVIEIDGWTQKISVKKNRGEVSFSLTSKSLPENKHIHIISVLREEFGIELRVPYGKTTIKSEKIDLLKNLLGKKIEDLNDEERELYSILTSKGLIETKEQKMGICEDNWKHQTSNSSTGICPTCGGKIKKFQSREYIELNEKNLLKEIILRLTKIYPKYEFKLENPQIDGETQFFIQIRGDKTEFYLYIDKGKSTGQILRRLGKSLIPTIQIVIDKKTNIKNSKFNSDLYAYNLLFEDGEKILKEINDNLISSFETILIKSTQEAREKLDKINNKELEINGDDFEDICYPLLRYLFYGIYKWGVKQKGRPVPDGLYGISHSGKSFSMIYDCKYSSGEYKLHRGEKIKARDYVRRTNQSKEIVQFSGGLSAYMIISNNVNQTQFDNLKTHLINLKSWKGKVVLLQSDGLIKLYDLFDKSNTLSNPLRFGLALYLAEFISNYKGDKVIINNKNVTEIFDKAKKNSPNLNELSVLNHLETDIEY